MSAMFRAVILGIVLGNVTLAPMTLEAAQPETSPAWTPALMMKVKQVGSVQVSPNGKQVAYTVRQAVMVAGQSEYLTHIHLADADGSRSVPLTSGDKSCDLPQWSPDGRWIAFISQRSGRKNLWVVDVQGGEPRQLSDLRTSVSSFQWSPDGRMLAFVAKDALTLNEIQRLRDKDDAKVVDENPKMNRLYVIPFTAPPKLQLEPRLLTKGDRSVGGGLGRIGKAPFDWSPDSRTIVFTHVKTPAADDWTTADVALVTVADGTVRPLLHTPAAEGQPLFSPDGKWIALVVNDQPSTWAGKGRIHVIAASGGKARPLADTSDDFGRYSELVGWSADCKSIYYHEAQGTKLALLAMPLEGAAVAVGRGLRVSVSGVSLNAARTHFGFALDSRQAPPEAMTYDIATHQATRVSRVHDDFEAPPLGRTDVISWKSTDGLAIEGLLTYPVGYEKGKRYPLLLIVHGGPMGVFTETFVGSASAYPVAAFASKGYAVLRPNPRGSSGYGAKFRYANYGDWGGGDFRDVMSGVDHVIQMGVADAERLGIMGWSYGGFMTSWTITQTKRFKAASVGAGVTNLVSFTGTADIPGFLPDYFGGEFWDNLEPYRKHSAMFNVKGVTTPTLIQHGDKDERVPLSQGLELYNALKRQGCVTKMVIYPRTPHGIEEPRLLLDCMHRNVEWFERHVPAARPGSQR